MIVVRAASTSTPEIPEPVLHPFNAERKSLLQIPPEVRFCEESTFWDPSWTIARGAIQTTNIVDLATSAAAIGEGVLLSPASYREQTSRTLAGFGSPIDGCATCMTLSDHVPYAVLASGWWAIGWRKIPPLAGTARSWAISRPASWPLP